MTTIFKPQETATQASISRRRFPRSARFLHILMIAALCSETAQASRQFQALSDKLLGGSLALPASGTVSVMVNPQFTSNDGLYHIFFEVMQPVDHGFQLLAGPGTIYAAWTNNNFFAVSAPNSLPVNAWTNVAVSWVNGGAMTLYINGVAVASNTGTPWFDTSGYPWSFGNRITGGYDARSQLAQLGVWNRVLTKAEITSLGNWALPSTIASGLISEYDLMAASLAPQTGGVGTLSATGAVTGPDLPPPPPPSFAIMGPSTATAGVPSYFSIVGTRLVNTTAVTFSDGGAQGTFSPSRVTLTGDSPSAPFAYTPSVNGSISISVTNDQSIANPSPTILQVKAIPPAPTLSADVFSKSVARGSDASYVITQAIPAGYTGDTPSLRVFNIPAGFTFSVNGVDCGASNAVISYFGWNSCGVSPAGSYTLTVHTGTLSAGSYYFRVAESARQLPSGSALTLELIVK